MSDPRIIRVELGARAYKIVIGDGVSKQACEYLHPYLKDSRVAIITDEKIAGLHLQTLLDALSGQDIQIETIVLPEGEAQKSFTTLKNLVDILLAKNFSRSDMLIAFGGGVIGDLAGFVASIFKRGCRFIQIPTTLLAQVDSSVGGKTAINTQAGKNLVGTFYQPSLVLTDTAFLKTLPERQLKAGYAEIVKMALINDAPFFDWLEENGKKVLTGDGKAQAHAIATSCAAKAKIVGEDECEQGQRAQLNLGHTFAHALEARTGYEGDLLHGEAVSAGLALAFDYACLQDMCPAGKAKRVRAHLDALEMPVFDRLPIALKSDPESLLGFMMNDKKNSGHPLTLILPRGIGDVVIVPDADQNSVLSYLQKICET